MVKIALSGRGNQMNTNRLGRTGRTPSRFERLNKARATPSKMRGGSMIIRPRLPKGSNPKTVQSKKDIAKKFTKIKGKML